MRRSASASRCSIDATAYRLVHGEADLLPSLIVDRYGDYLVVQTLSQGMDRLLPASCALLVELLAPARHPGAQRSARRGCSKGWSSRSRCCTARCRRPSSVEEAGIAYDVDPRHGQKTGLFLDQRENRDAAARYAHGRLLDCFSYNGGFALRLAPHCRESIAIDISEDAVARIARQRRAERRRNVDARAATSSTSCGGSSGRGERFDTIVLDPPAFAKNKAAVAKATAGYKEINLRALKLLSPGGTLVTCSCSYNVNEATFAEIVYDAAVDAQAHVTVVEKRMQGRDHPVLLGVPETYYLKCFILRKLA